MKKKYILLALLAFFENAKADKFECSKAITTNQQLQSSIESWNVNNVTANNNFSRIFLTTDHKNHSSRLRADEEITQGGKYLEKYDLQFYKDSGMKIFVECTYFNTSVSLFKEIPNSISTCELEYESKNGSASKTILSCS